MVQLNMWQHILIFLLSTFSIGKNVNADKAATSVPDTVTVYGTYFDYQTYTDPPSIIVKTEHQYHITDVTSGSLKKTIG
ncbi:hypothetical protein K7432_008538 [Basidiobolus ranarum]|uniref:Uncharacterized protein n=1 Tax=Basidiobolus ranarum TaxID=34480 RepID=A0ABR2VYM0_9FUNG